MKAETAFLFAATPKRIAAVTQTIHPDQVYLDAWGLTAGHWASLSLQERAYRRWNVAKALHYNATATQEGTRS